VVDDCLSAAVILMPPPNDSPSAASSCWRDSAVATFRVSLSSSATRPRLRREGAGIRGERVGDDRFPFRQ
jgi:hypothetical protein